jgi:hypothetical protein
MVQVVVLFRATLLATRPQLQSHVCCVLVFEFFIISGAWLTGCVGGLGLAFILEEDEEELLELIGTSKLLPVGIGSEFG